MLATTITTTAAHNATTADLITECGEYSAAWQYEAEAHAERVAACRAAYAACKAERAAYRAANPIPEGEYSWAEYMAFEAPVWAIVPEEFMPEGMSYDPELSGEDDEYREEWDDEPYGMGYDA